MTIELSTGEKAVIRDRVTHKAHREYQNAVLRDVVFKNEKRADGTDVEPSFNLTQDSVSAAAEVFALAMIERVEPATGTPFPPTHEWLDNLPQDDFIKIDAALMKLKRGKDEDAKNE